jgi:hypothetical protein
MPAYPLTKFHNSSRESPINEIASRRMGNAGLKKKVLYSGKKAFVLRHIAVSDATKATLEAFLATNIAADVTFTWRDGVVYTTQFVKPCMSFVPYAGPSKKWDVEVTLEQV